MLPIETPFHQLSLENLEELAWQLMADGKQSSKSDIHQFFVATSHSHIPELRTVILRDVNQTENWISFHTDARSKKVEQMQQNENVSALLYSLSQRVQLRLQCKASVHHNDYVTEAAWQSARLQSKLSYSNIDAPGTLLYNPVLIDVNRMNVSDDELLQCKNNFAVVRLSLISLDMVILHHAGNKRLLKKYDTQLLTWLQP
jgi:pyridoxamine 5'-phosphate oxidase